MRIRSTKPEFWRSKTIAALAWDVRLVLKGLESYVDDNGVGKDDIALIAADVFPRDLSANPRDTLARLSEAISHLSRSGLVARYEIDGEELLYIDKWRDLQRIDKPGRGRFPRPDGTTEYSEVVNRDSYRNPRETVASPPEKVAPGTGEQGSSGTEEQGNSSFPSSVRNSPARQPGERREAGLVALNSTAHSPQAHAIARAYEDATGPVPGKALGQIAVAIDGCLKAGIDPTQIADGLKAWTASPITAASQIESFVHRAGTKPTEGKPTRKARSYADAADQLLAEVRTIA